MKQPQLVLILYAIIVDPLLFEFETACARALSAVAHFALRILTYIHTYESTSSYY